MKELAMIYARLMNQYKFKYQTVFSARFDKQAEDGEFLDETELFINLYINHNLTQSDLDKINTYISIRISDTTKRNERFWMAI